MVCRAMQMRKEEDEEMLVSHQLYLMFNYVRKHYNFLRVCIMKKNVFSLYDSFKDSNMALFV